MNLDLELTIDSNLWCTIDSDLGHVMDSDLGHMVLHSRLGARWSDIDVTKSLKAGIGMGTFAGNRGPTVRQG